MTNNTNKKQKIVIISLVLLVLSLPFVSAQINAHHLVDSHQDVLLGVASEFAIGEVLGKVVGSFKNLVRGKSFNMEEGFGTTPNINTIKVSDLGEEAQKTIQLIKEGKTGSLGAHTFKNLEGKLPKQSVEDYYTTHYLDNIGKKNPQRIITGKNGEIYYTPDHYTEIFYEVK